MQQQKKNSLARHQVVCIMFKEIVQLNFTARKLCSEYWTLVKPPNRFSQYFNIEYCAQRHP